MNSLFKKLRGYQKANRDRFLLLSRRELTHEEFILYELVIALTDWDEKHLDTHGTFRGINKKLAALAGWEDDSAVSRHKKSLIKKGFLILNKDGSIKPKDFEDWKLRKQSAENQTTDANIQLLSANIQEESAIKQEIQLQTADYPLVSSKVDLSLDEPLNESLSDDELIQIISNIDSKGVASESDPSQRLEEEYAN